MDRKARILAPLDVKGRGLEIGPSHSPIAPKREGFDVNVLDHSDRAGLVQKYQAHGVDLDAIEEVDFVWKGGRYVDLIGRDRYDWIIASHAIEHMPDLVGFLNDCDALLREGGVLSLAVPDKRYCFDRFRPLTGISQLVDAHFEDRRNHSPGRVADYFLNVIRMRECLSWDQGVADLSTKEDVEFVHTTDEAISGIRAIMQDNAYLDIHAWCFTPSSFRLLMDDLHRLKLVELRESSFHPTVGNEFFISLSRSGHGPGIDRLALLQQAETEMAVCAMPLGGPSLVLSPTN